MKISLCQIHPMIGALERNSAAILQAAQQAHQSGAELALFSELVVSGYPPRDLLLRPGFLGALRTAVLELAPQLPLPCLIGAPWRDEQTGQLFNTALWLEAGRVRHVFKKRLLPCYDVFNEPRYFTPGGFSPDSDAPHVITHRGLRIAVTLCEDIWAQEPQLIGRYTYDPVQAIHDAGGADLLLNLSASPYTLNKLPARLGRLKHIAQTLRCPALYVNQVGAHDGLLFDGHSVAVNSAGEVTHLLPGFEAAAALWEPGAAPLAIAPFPLAIPEAACPSILGHEAQVRAALTMGIRDGVIHSGFDSVVLGLSGGIDSAVTATLAVEALGADRVLGVLLPSRYSSQGSIDDALALAQALGIQTLQLPIAAPVLALEESLMPMAQQGHGVSAAAEELMQQNLQARVRGVLLMALANQQGRLLLTTGNKSELAVGYCTLYGDMCGALAPLADLYKGEVYELAHFLNRLSPGAPRIPQSTLEKPPSAELRPDQTDQDTLPPYPVLDALLHGYLEHHWPVSRLVAAGFTDAPRIEQLVLRSEHKRFQATIGLKIHKRALGEGWQEAVVKQGAGF